MRQARMMPALRGEALLDALSTGRLSEDVMLALFLAASTWLESGGTTSMERFLRLPATGAQLKNATRNHWLRKASDTMDEPSPFKRACNLERELRAFITRGPWLTWRDSQHPPEGCSELRRCLFYVAKFNDGDGLTDRTIYKALK